VRGDGRGTTSAPRAPTPPIHHHAPIQLLKRQVAAVGLCDVVNGGQHFQHRLRGAAVVHGHGLADGLQDELLRRERAGTARKRWCNTAMGGGTPASPPFALQNAGRHSLSHRPILRPRRSHRQVGQTPCRPTCRSNGRNSRWVARWTAKRVASRVPRLADRTAAMALIACTQGCSKTLKKCCFGDRARHAEFRGFGPVTASAQQRADDWRNCRGESR